MQAVSGEVEQGTGSRGGGALPSGSQTKGGRRIQALNTFPLRPQGLKLELRIASICVKRGQSTFSGGPGYYYTGLHVS